ALKMAREILHAPQENSRRFRDDNPRGIALHVLRDFKELDSYVTELQQALEREPGSVPLLMQLGEACGIQGKSPPADYYRAALKLQPNNSQLALMLALLV